MLWVFGDSFTAEYHPVGDPKVHSYYDEYKEWRGGNLPDVWPTLLAKKLQTTVNNFGIGAGSNYTILHRFLDNVHNIKENDIVIIGWSQNIRYVAADFVFNILTDMGPHTTTKNNANYSQNTCNEILLNRDHPAWIDEVHKWIKFIHMYCQLKKIILINWSSDKNLNFDLISNPPDNDLIYHINETLYDGKKISNIKDETGGVVNDGHHGEFGHKLMCEYFYNLIKN